MCGLASCRTPSWRGGSAAAYSQEVCLALPYVNDRRVRAGTINVGDFGSSSVNGQFASDGGATKPALLLDERRTPFLVCEAARQKMVPKTLRKSTTTFSSGRILWSPRASVAGPGPAGRPGAQSATCAQIRDPDGRFGIADLGSGLDQLKLRPSAASSQLQGGPRPRGKSNVNGRDANEGVPCHRDL